LVEGGGSLGMMERGGGGNGHLRRGLGVRLYELEMLDHRVAVEIELADDAHAFRPRLHAVERNALSAEERFGPAESFEKIEVPPCATKFTVGHGLEAGFLLPVDDRLNLAILDRLELIGGRFSLFGSWGRVPDS